MDIEIYVQPRARRTEIAGLHGEAIKIRVAAAPVDGAANDELVRFLARTLGVPRSSVAVTHGATSRRKRVAIDGLAAADVAQRLLGSRDATR